MAKVQPAWSKRITSSCSTSSASQAWIQSVIMTSLVLLMVWIGGDGGTSLVDIGLLWTYLGMELFAVRFRCRRQLTLYEIVFVAKLAQERWNHLAVACEDRRSRGRKVVLD